MSAFSSALGPRSDQILEMTNVGQRRYDNLLQGSSHRADQVEPGVKLCLMNMPVSSTKRLKRPPSIACSVSCCVLPNDSASRFRRMSRAAGVLAAQS